MMNDQRVYHEWKEQRRRTQVPADFSARVMEAVHAAETLNRADFLDDAGFDQLMLRLADRRATAAALLILGLLRLIYWAGQFLSVGAIAP